MDPQPSVMELQIETEREDDGRWLAEVASLPGVMIYDETRDGALLKTQALALRVVAERLEQGELPLLLGVTFSIS